MDIRSRKWHPETCHEFGLQTNMLPEIKSNAEIFGHVKEGPLEGAKLISYYAYIATYIFSCSTQS